MVGFLFFIIISLYLNALLFSNDANIVAEASKSGLQRTLDPFELSNDVQFVS